MICIRCTASLPDAVAATDSMCVECERELDGHKRRIQEVLSTAEFRFRRSSDGLTTKRLADLLERLDNLGNWEAEKLVDGIIGTTEGADS